jgi:hypothetical protein
MVIHKAVPVLVWVDADEGIAEMLREVNDILGVRCHASCQGTVGEGGSAPYRAQIMVSWQSEQARQTLSDRYDLDVEGSAWGYVHPKHAPCGV